MRGTLTIFAAASLTAAFNEMKGEIERANPGASVVINYAGSQVLRTQLGLGARADVFASADTQNMDGARLDGSIEQTPAIFAHNKLVVAVPASGTKVSTIQDMARTGVKVVLNQPAVPAGNYSRQVLAKLSADPAYGPMFGEQVLGNVVSLESDVKALLSRLQLGEADAGMLYVSDVASAPPGQVRGLAIPDAFNVVADYPLAMVKGAPNEAAARAFIEYVLPPGGGQVILAKSGLLPVAG